MYIDSRYLFILGILTIIPVDVTGSADEVTGADIEGRSHENAREKVSWLVVLGFNATLTAKVISWRSVTHVCFLAFTHQY